MFYDKDALANLFTGEYFFNKTKVSLSVIHTQSGKFQTSHCRVGVED